MHAVSSFGIIPGREVLKFGEVLSSTIKNVTDGIHKVEAEIFADLIAKKGELMSFGA